MFSSDLSCLIPFIFIPSPTPTCQIDTSRIVRPDYASLPYTKLATAAQALWRTTFAPEHYHQTGLCVTASGPEQQYVTESLRNVQAIGTDKTEVLQSSADIQRVCGLESNSSAEGNPAPAGGSVGYVNWSSGWADAEGAMRWLRCEVERFNRVEFLTGTVKKLNIDHARNTVSGVILEDGTTLEASLTILAAGAWSPALLDLRGICKSTGQALVYLPISDSEQAALGDKPTLLNLSTGLFMITPSRNMLKIARHGHGYTNPTTIPHPEAPPSATHEETITVSLPYTHMDDPTQDILPLEAQKECRAFLSGIHPSLSQLSRPWSKTRICWYTDTPSGDFLIDYHPKYKGLFVATGGSGHAFKFLPVIGDCIVDCILGRTPEDFREKWAWPKERVPEELWEGDGSRGGPVGMVLREEMEKSRRARM
ncbi:FAD dependent oxidoreductase [Westerdykella ornata]|uniref:FAD dependent oxidoreductase n=1 Tax=Westerdykella ornata TaxID=318751 RepID=A0A6A6JV34_WESOR|nr:FAD dependent oxidoreductase [Westerdykella ornata]KAF2280247.1 FAD dependent oxidoreductase [Westerdykella ornata]